MKIVVWKSEINGQWYWRLVGRNGHTILVSEGYKRLGSVAKVVASVQKRGLDVPIRLATVPRAKGGIIAKVPDGWLR